MKYKDWSKFKIYCSRINTLMGQPKGFPSLSKTQTVKHDFLSNKIELTGKESNDLAFLDNKLSLFLNPPVLSVSAQDYLVEIYSRERYGIRKASSGGLAKTSQAKGFALEKEGIELLSKVDKVQYSKETNVISDDYFLGVCDILCHESDKILEIKTSWNVSNFMKNKRSGYKLPSEIWGQVQGYLHLYKMPKAQVCYVLVNTPPHLIEQEWANIFKKYSYGEITREKYDEGCYKLDGIFDYNKIPESKRVIRFDISSSPAYINKVKTKIDMARVWLNDFEKRFMSGKNIETNPEYYIQIQDTESNEEESVFTT